MSGGLRARRLDEEWRLLEELVALNPHCLKEPSRARDVLADELSVTLFDTSALLESGEMLDEHSVRLRFPRFFPSQPIEAYLATPVFHPNVDPENGFVCLWTKTDTSHTSMEALRRIQLALTWRAWNEEADHTMQPAALDWLRDEANRRRLPLPCKPLVEAEGISARAVLPGPGQAPPPPLASLAARGAARGVYNGRSSRHGLHQDVSPRRPQGLDRRRQPRNRPGHRQSDRRARRAYRARRALRGRARKGSRRPAGARLCSRNACARHERRSFDRRLRRGSRRLRHPRQRRRHQYSQTV